MSKNTMTLPKRRGSFLEIGGNFGIKMQAAYEEAARRASELNAPVTVTAKITIGQPDRHGIGKVKYTLGATAPAYKSADFETEVDHTGTIIATAPMDIGVMQESLYFADEEVPEAITQ